MRTLRVGLGLALAFALATAPALTACSRKAEDSQATEEQTATAVVEDTADKDAEVEAEQGDEGTQTVDDGLVETSNFSFVIPEYWQGRVRCNVGENQGKTAVSLTLSNNPEAVLATLTLVDGAEAEVAGDIGSHLVGSVSDGKVHVEVWANNWPWLAASGYTQEYRAEDVSELVDLSTGGALSYEDAVSAGPDAVVTAEREFISSQLVPTVTLG